MMAAPKSQPLHNFSLPRLKWAHKTPTAPSTHPHPPDHRRTADSDSENPNQEAVEEENGDFKPWKLRPRKEVIKTALSSKKDAVTDGKNQSNLKSQRLRGIAAEGGKQNGGAERSGKRKVWISLSKEEIEDDVYALTGGKPGRRPRRWPKNVQKQLDNVFPGLYLVGVAADSYRVMMSWYALLYDFIFLILLNFFCMHVLAMYAVILYQLQ